MADRNGYPEGQVTYPLCIKLWVRPEDQEDVGADDHRSAWIDIDYHVVPCKGDEFALSIDASEVKRVCHWSPLASMADAWTEVHLEITLDAMRALKKIAPVREKDFDEKWHFD